MIIDFTYARRSLIPVLLFFVLFHTIHSLLYVVFENIYKMYKC